MHRFFRPTPQHSRKATLTFAHVEAILTLLVSNLTSASASGGTGGNFALESYSYQAETGVLSSKGGQALSYTAQVSCPEGSRSLPHAASAMGANTYSYDCSGNMTQRVIGGSTYNLAYDAENRLSTVSGAASATYVYDGDGVRVKSAAGGTTTVTIGSYFEWTGSSSTMKRYYEAGGSRVGMRQGSTLYWLVSDHLGSTSVTANASGSLYGRLLYKAWGEQRWSSGTTPTTYRYTGQRRESSLGLYYYGARWYDPNLSRWLQPDTIIPGPYNPQDWDRYGYCRNNPIRYIDPTGHYTEEEIFSILGVKKWDEVYALFNKGGKYEGMWGILDILRMANDGDRFLGSFGEFDTNIVGEFRTH